MNGMTRQGLLVALALALTAWLAGCGAASETERPAGFTGGGGDSGDQTKKKRKRDVRDEGDDAGEDEDGEEDGDAEGGDGGGDGPGGGGDGGGGEDGGAPSEGRHFFDATVKPLFDRTCVSCHADPRQEVIVRAPLSIYSYDRMRAYLTSGPTSADNALYNRVAGLINHGGGNRCTGGPASSPCKELRDWWALEVGGGQGGDSGVLGALTTVEPLGKVYGWAVDPDDQAAQLTVRFYLDGPSGTGTAIGEAVADRDGPDGDTPGAHAFVFDLPLTARDKQQRKLYAYAVIGGMEKALAGSGQDFVAYAFSAAGRTFYQQNVQGALGGCAGCHTVSYEQQFYALISPAPSQGATAGNNRLINKAAEANGTTHGGGRRCNAVNAGLCAQLQAWWNVEFGN